MEALEEDIGTLANNIRQLNKQLSLVASESVTEGAPAQLRAQLKEFVDDALRTVDDLEQQLSAAKRAAKDLAAHFCEDLASGQFQLQACFKLFADFIDKVELAAKVGNGLGEPDLYWVGNHLHTEGEVVAYPYVGGRSPGDAVKYDLKKKSS